MPLSVRTQVFRAFSMLLGLFAILFAKPIHADLLHDLTTQRHWIGYAPRNFNPNAGREPSQDQLRADLTQLYDEGWRGIYTYSLDGVLKHVPRIAKEVGFDYAMGGIFYFNEAQLTREKAAAAEQLEHIDGFIVGNEGLLFGRYPPERLLEEIAYFQTLGRPVTTTEVGGFYLAVPELIDVGDFVFYNTHPWFSDTIDPADPESLAELVAEEYFAIRELRPDKTIVIKESWYPSAGPPQASEENQVAFFRALADQRNDVGESILFAWGEAYDQPWKSEPSPWGTLGRDWGFHTANGDPKLIVDALRDVYTGPVPPAVPEPSGSALVILGCAIVLAARKRRQSRSGGSLELPGGWGGCVILR